ncbi:HD-GYP domain-containing protein [Sphingomonas fuzhouensis]|uniref:HD-GYP domain-containing protein n=1 Tax=Sphingomonas fuzhouensis TaxID=3106033 RepID=UPI002AFFF0A1|nr:HD-GYP domain-containing protein [Sphingomonas sp. SGZ-02]
MEDHSGTNRYIRIRGDQVELGMYVHAVHCPWLQNPFWSKSFLVTTRDDVAKIRESVPAVTIDLTKGRGLTLIGATTPVDVAPEPVVTEPAVTPLRPRRAKPLTELERAGVVSAHAAAAIEQLFGEVRLGRSIQTSDLLPIVETIKEAIAKSAAAMIAVTRLKEQDQYIYIHSVAVCTLMMSLARQLGLSEEAVHVAGMAGLLHDIGKLHIPVAILNKPGRLTAEEMQIIRRHPGLGHDILAGMADLDPRILDVCRHHHERMDGAGYPDGLKGDEISQFVRISSVCDVYDALTSIRPYKRAWSPHEALAQMQEWEGHFDPDMVRAFIATLFIQPFAALVRLQSNRLGIVVREGANPTTPIVRTFFHIPDQSPIRIEDVATANDPIIRAERGDYWFGDRWPTLRAEILAHLDDSMISPQRAAGGR